MSLSIAWLGRTQSVSSICAPRLTATGMLSMARERFNDCVLNIGLCLASNDARLDTQRLIDVLIDRIVWRPTTTDCVWITFGERRSTSHAAIKGMSHTKTACAT